MGPSVGSIRMNGIPSNRAPDQRADQRKRLSVAVLVSGRGSNLQALIDACSDPAFPAQIVLVLSNVPSAPALARARSAGLPTEVLDHRDYGSRDLFDAALRTRVEKSAAGLVCLAGFMRLLTPAFVATFQERLINVHPSLLPAFPGLHTHERALAAGARYHGCTIHFVSAETDAGPIIAQSAVPVRPDDTVESLSARVLETEHVCYPQAVRWFAEGRLSVENGVVHVRDARAPQSSLINPVPDGPGAGATSRSDP